MTSITQLVHHGLIFVPIGYTFGGGMFELEKVKGGSPYGAGTYAGDGSRQPSELELAQAFHQGKYFAGIAKKLKGSQWFLSSIYLPHHILCQIKWDVRSKNKIKVWENKVILHISSIQLLSPLVIVVSCNAVFIVNNKNLVINTGNSVLIKLITISHLTNVCFVLNWSLSGQGFEFIDRYCLVFLYII